MSSSLLVRSAFGISAYFWRLNVLFSTGMNRSNLNGRISSPDTFPITVTLLLHYPCLDILHAAHHITKSSNMKPFTGCRRPTQSASDARKRPRSNTSKGCGRNSRTSSSSLNQTPSSDVSPSHSFRQVIVEHRFSHKVVAETVVGATTGALPAPKGYFKAMKSVCRKYGALFILDEVMSGMGRESPGSP